MRMLSVDRRGRRRIRCAGGIGRRIRRRYFGGTNSGCTVWVNRDGRPARGRAAEAGMGRAAIARRGRAAVAGRGRAAVAGRGRAAVTRRGRAAVTRRGRGDSSGIDGLLGRCEALTGLWGGVGGALGTGGGDVRPAHQAG